MSKWPASWRIFLIVILAVGGALTGCMPMADTPLDEEKDPNFIEGRNHYNMMDYKGAIECFERAVQANPRNAAAHFELAVLYHQKLKEPDFVAAIYHYQKHLELRPKSEYLTTITPMIANCKLQIARTVTGLVVTTEVFRDLGRLTNELANVKRENDALRSQMQAKPMVLTQWQTLRVTNLVHVTNNPGLIASPVLTNAARAVVAAPTTNATRRVEARTTPTPAPVRQTPAPVARATVTPLPPTRASQFATQQPRAMRSHAVRAGDTMAEIARRYGISVERLRAANPSVQPSRLRPGQVLNIPPQ